MYTETRKSDFNSIKRKILIPYEILTRFEMILAGGALTAHFSGQRIKDFDFYFKTPTAAKKANDYFLGAKEYHHIFSTPNAETFRYTNEENKSCLFQLILVHSAMGDPIQVLRHFDFTMCKAALDLTTKEFTFDNRFFADLSQRRLIFQTATLYPITSLLRARKFMARGYTMSNIELLKLALTINSLNLKNYGDLKDQIIGIDSLLLTAMMENLSSAEKAEEAYSFESTIQMIEDAVEQFLNPEEEGED
jgi:hypothetical protein